MDENCDTWKNLQRFAKAHGLRLEPVGEVGFGRSCVALLLASPGLFVAGVLMIFATPLRERMV